MMKFQRIYPDFKGPNSAEESVAMQKNDIEKITIEDSGEFLSHLGTKEQCAFINIQYLSIRIQYFSISRKNHIIE